MALAAVISAPAVRAGELDAVFNKFKNRPNVEYVKVPKWLVKLGGLSADIGAEPLAGKVEGVKVLSMSDASKADKARFDNRFSKAASSLDEMLRVNDGGDKVTILTRKDGDKYRNIYILATDSSQCTLVEISGKFTADDIREMVNKND